MERVAFRLKIKSGLIDEYVARHTAVWPEMLSALEEAGWSNYSLFLDRSDGTLVGYFETLNLERALVKMAKTEVNTQWQAGMAPFFDDLEGKAPDNSFIRLEEVFNLQRQLHNLSDSSQ